MARKTSRGRRMARNQMGEREATRILEKTRGSLGRADDYIRDGLEAIAPMGHGSAPVTDPTFMRRAYDQLLLATQWLSQASALYVILNGFSDGRPSVVLDDIEAHLNHINGRWAYLRDALRSAI